MFGFGTKAINVEFYLSKIRHNLESSKFINLKENREYAKKIYDFVDYYAKKRGAEIHSEKLDSLQKVMIHLAEFMKLCDDGKEGELADSFQMILKWFDDYSSFGATYLLRHPDKSKVEGRNLTSLGVKQAKEVAELIKEEILISPKPVKIFFYTSELRRTYLFASIINQINNAEKIGKSDIKTHQEEDKRLFMGHISEDFYTIYNAYKEKHPKGKWEFLAFRAWVDKTAEFQEVIKRGGIKDPVMVRDDITSFVMFADAMTYNKDYHVLVIGISHSWMIDTWLFHYTGIEEIISTAEYAKIEKNHLYYKGKWLKL